MTRHRPAFDGIRFVVMDWQMDDLTRMLGKHADSFDLFAWLLQLDKELEHSGEVLPPKPHDWLKERTFAEARRRGLPLATTPQYGKLSNRLLNMVDRVKR